MAREARNHLLETAKGTKTKTEGKIDPKGVNGCDTKRVAEETTQSSGDDDEATEPEDESVEETNGVDDSDESPKVNNEVVEEVNEASVDDSSEDVDPSVIEVDAEDVDEDDTGIVAGELTTTDTNGTVVEDTADSDESIEIDEASGSTSGDSASGDPASDDSASADSECVMEPSVSPEANTAEPSPPIGDIPEVETPKAHSDSPPEFDSVPNSAEDSAGAFVTAAAPESESESANSVEQEEESPPQSEESVETTDSVTNESMEPTTPAEVTITDSTRGDSISVECGNSAIDEGSSDNESFHDASDEQALYNNRPLEESEEVGAKAESTSRYLVKREVSYHTPMTTPDHEYQLVKPPYSLKRSVSFSRPFTKRKRAEAFSEDDNRLPTRQLIIAMHEKLVRRWR
ncbi:hypothetical protein CJU90_0719 [Yarrowia sp. C11]|nr:hypothetical protein CKK34_2131 [Yarrowia sp. E02]KAG5373052.1 hypothetical protein CJU90_0719 [Yarrowia sp. C11]